MITNHRSSQREFMGRKRNAKEHETRAAWRTETAGYRCLSASPGVSFLIFHCLPRPSNLNSRDCIYKTASRKSDLTAAANFPGRTLSCSVASTASSAPVSVRPAEYPSISNSSAIPRHLNNFSATTDLRGSLSIGRVSRPPLPRSMLKSIPPLKRRYRVSSSTAGRRLKFSASRGKEISSFAGLS